MGNFVVIGAPPASLLHGDRPELGGDHAAAEAVRKTIRDAVVVDPAVPIFQRWLDSGAESDPSKRRFNPRDPTAHP